MDGMQDRTIAVLVTKVGGWVIEIYLRSTPKTNFTSKFLKGFSKKKAAGSNIKKLFTGTPTTTVKIGLFRTRKNSNNNSREQNLF